jgi:hypothetical protein
VDFSERELVLIPKTRPRPSLLLARKQHLLRPQPASPDADEGVNVPYGIGSVSEKTCPAKAEHGRLSGAVQPTRVGRDLHALVEQPRVLGVDVFHDEDDEQIVCARRSRLT